MSGLILRVGAAVFAVATLSAVVVAGTAPVVPVPDLSSSADLAAVAPRSAPSAPDILPPPIATQSPTAIPLPPGVVAGLFGLASAAIARRRYLKR